MRQVRQLWSTLLLGAFVFAACAQTPVEPYRQVLLVGVWDYEHQDDLGEMDADLALLDDSFDAIKFDTIKRLRNPKWNDLDGALAAMVARAKAMRDTHGVLSVVYFSGHGTRVDESSYLLASDFVPPLVESALVVSGAMSVSYITARFRAVGEPLVIIVGACRNHFTPPQPAVVLPPPVLGPWANYPRMIDAPPPYLGVAVWYAQRPGLLLQIANPDPRVPTPFAQAIADVLPWEADLGTLAGAVQRRVIEATRNQTHPATPYIELSGGNILLAYSDDDRTRDDNAWRRARDSGREDVVQDFLARLLTSRYRVAARQWLETRASLNAQATAELFVTYTPALRRTLGTQAGELFDSALYHLQPSSTEMASLSVGDRTIAAADVRRLRRLPGASISFEAALQDSEIVMIDHALPHADPSRLIEFWRDATPVDTGCTPPRIERGDCTDIEVLAQYLRGSVPEAAGTLFIASVAGTDATFDARKSHERVIAVTSRFNALAVRSDTYAFRSFTVNELAQARSPLLFKRGDGRAVSQLEADR